MSNIKLFNYLTLKTLPEHTKKFLNKSTDHSVLFRICSRQLEIRLRLWRACGLLLEHYPKENLARNWANRSLSSWLISTVASIASRLTPCSARTLVSVRKTCVRPRPAGQPIHECRRRSIFPSNNMWPQFVAISICLLRLRHQLALLPTLFAIRWSQTHRQQSARPSISLGGLFSGRWQCLSRLPNSSLTNRPSSS